MAAIAADRDLLFGLLALQNGLINQVQLVAAFQAWTLDRTRALADHLVGRGDLDADDRSAVEALVTRHLRKHGGDVERSLAAIPASRSTRESLARIEDPDVGGTLAHLGAASTQDGDDQERTASYAIGAATSEGQRFRILRPHARGGLGAVFVALDTELHREVALKQILDQHADDPTSRQRFLVEAEITGGLEHPGIVPVYGLGSYSDGRPYYAMRFIRGDSLKEATEQFHADEALKKDSGRRSLELRKLLRQFVDVCNAIDYAHSRGVLHRDIKPGNIIVGKHGETLVVDWGLAKAKGRAEAAESSGERPLVPSSASSSAETLPGSALGTPSYMSPEQAEGDLERLGPRSDVYSLGATLYYLLTGRPPAEGDIGEVLRAVRRGEFPPPRWHDATIDPALQAVCLKAMALKPEDRNPSPKALAEDVERWMADEPVTAWREPLSRRARRWGKRHRTVATAAVVALLAGVIGLGSVAGVQARANTQLRDANAETQAALRQSEESRRQAEAVSTFLVQAFRSPDPSQDGRLVKVIDVLDRASERLDKELVGSQEVRGKLLESLGRTYWSLGLFDRSVSLHTKARAVREAALGPDHPDTLISRVNLAIAYQSAGQYPEAIALLEETLKREEAAVGPNHIETLRCRINLGNSYLMAGRYPEGIALHETSLTLRAARLGPDHPDTLAGRKYLAHAYESLGRWPDAERTLRDVLARRRKTVKPDSPDLADDLAALGRDLIEQARWPEAEPLLHEGLGIFEKATPDDWLRHDAMSLLGAALLGQRRYASAEPLVVAGYEGMKARESRISVPERPRLLQAAERVVRLYEEWNKPDQATAWKARLGISDLPADVFARP